MTDNRRYMFKLYPTKSQMTALERQCALSAMLWNAALEQREAQWRHQCQMFGKGDRKGIGKYDQSKELKFIRANDPEYAAMSADSMALVIKALDNAFAAFYRRARAGAGASSGYPRYKSSHPDNHRRHGTIWHRDHRKGWRMDHQRGVNWKVYAKGIPGLIKARGRFPVSDYELRDMQIIRRDGGWWISIVVKFNDGRDGERGLARCNPAIANNGCDTKINFTLIDEFAHVEMRKNGQCLSGETGFLQDGKRESSMQSGICASSCSSALQNAGERQDHHQAGNASCCSSAPRDAAILSIINTQLRIDGLLSDCDTKHVRFSYRWKKKRQAIAKLQAKAARQRRDFLHKFTTDIVAASKSIEVLAPNLGDVTKSGRGTEKNHGAAVQLVADINRRVLAQCPGYAIQMLDYKAKAADVPINIMTDEKPDTAIGQSISKTVKATRKARRVVRRAQQDMQGDNSCHIQ